MKEHNSEKHIFRNPLWMRILAIVLTFLVASGTVAFLITLFVNLLGFLD